MIRALGAAVLLCVAAPLAAQQVTEADGAILRGLDKVNGTVYDINIRRGETAAFELINITLNNCRYPVGNPSGDAYASLEITEGEGDSVLFSGWMIASAPALSAMDHARYDIWVMRCTTS
jgi:hypothetical protein